MHIDEPTDKDDSHSLLEIRLPGKASLSRNKQMLSILHMFLALGGIFSYILRVLRIYLINFKEVYSRSGIEILLELLKLSQSFLLGLSLAPRYILRSLVIG
jgi:hypothetical protein